MRLMRSMTIDSANLSRLDLTLWAVVAAAAAIVFGAPAVSDFRIAWSSFLLPGGACFVLLIAARFYGARQDLRLASALGATAMLLAFSAVGGPLSYLAASANLPLLDHAFDAADRALGFGWRGLLEWMNAIPMAHPLFGLAYQSFTVQASVAILCLSFSGRFAHLRTFLLAFMAAALVTIAISACTPAAGVWGHYGLHAIDHPAINPVTREFHLPVFHGLRDGSYRLLAGLGSMGIITFPSFHSAIALLFIFAFWPMPVIRWVGVVVNVLMIAATPVDGGHYFVDVLAGLVIAAGCWLGASAFVERSLARARVASFAAVQGSPLARD
jgi:membrane-associated phospholipid phosphatase